VAPHFSYTLVVISWLSNSLFHDSHFCRAGSVNGESNRFAKYIGYLLSASHDVKLGTDRAKHSLVS